MRALPEPLEVARAHGVILELADGRKLIDAISSWWCVIHGYNHPALNASVTGQIQQMAHVMLGGLVHAPARAAAELLVRITPPGLNHVFFSDSGSVGVEIALKMALQFWQSAGRPEKSRFLALRKAYHGDTIGAMSVCDPDAGMHALFRSILPAQIFIDPPRALPGESDTATLAGDLARLDAVLRQRANEIAAFILEPVAQMAGGFSFYSEAFLAGARELCDRHDVLFIFDEVATGFGRTGTLFAADRASVTPDIMVLGKALTGGYTGHAATIATTRVFEQFSGDDASRAFMHGPTFMANPIACALMLAGYHLFESENYLAKIARIESILREELLGFEHQAVAGTRVLGATGVIEMKTAASLRGAREFATQRGVWLRPFDRYLYTMPAYIIEENDLRRVTTTMLDFCRQA
jgi:adenosylmethionine---8-amino-7-oxononanoate aminotransferase